MESTKVSQKTETGSITHNSPAQCQQCCHYKAINLKYEKLINLLHQKIRQLERKTTNPVDSTQTSALEHLPAPSAYQKLNAFRLHRVVQQTIIQLTDKPTLKSSTFPIEIKLENTFSNSQGFKWGSLVNTLSEEIMQLKSNVMHIRACLYSLFREGNLWSTCSRSQTATNIALVLFNIFQYSEAERQEMCRYKKVKLRKKCRQEEKENLFVTIKEI